MSPENPSQLFYIYALNFEVILNQNKISLFLVVYTLLKNYILKLKYGTVFVALWALRTHLNYFTFISIRKFGHQLYEVFGKANLTWTEIVFCRN